MKLLVVNVEPTEADVIQVKVDPDKLEQFLDENMHHSGHHEHLSTAGTMTFF